LFSYNVSVNAVVDFRGGNTSDWDPLWQDFYCDWRNIYFNQGIAPPSWAIGDQVLAAGAKGILFQLGDHSPRKPGHLYGRAGRDRCNCRPRPGQCTSEESTILGMSRSGVLASALDENALKFQ